VSQADDRDPRVARWLRHEAPAGVDDGVLRDIGERIRSTPQRASRWGGFLASTGPILAGTAAVTLAAAVLMVVIPRGEGGGPAASGENVASATLGTSPAESSAPDEPSDSGIWSALALPDPRPEEVQGEIPNDAVAGGPGFVAVGRSYPANDGLEPYDDRQWTPAIWTSVDGAAWHLADDLGSLGPADLQAVAPGPDGRLLAVGADTRGLGPDDEPPAGVGMWTSADGIHWEMAPAPAGDVYTFTDVIGTEDGWLVAGYPATGGPTIFASSDLEAWTTERLPAGQEDGIDGLFGDAAGRVLAYGCDHPTEDDRGFRAGCEEPTGWLRNGPGWEAVHLPILPIVGGVLDDRFVIIGQTEAGAASFSSVDGRAWEEGDTLPAGFASSLLVTGHGLAVGGSIQLGEDRFLPAVWQSADGTEWEGAELLPVEGTPSEPTVTAMVETPSGLVGLGYAYYDKPVAQAWVRSPP
jgi:hypothetical protein